MGMGGFQQILEMRQSCYEESLKQVSCVDISQILLSEQETYPGLFYLSVQM